MGTVLAEDGVGGSAAGESSVPEGSTGTAGGSAANGTGVARGWKVGDPIDNLTSAGKVPSWDTVRNRYWKNESINNPLKYSD